MSALPEQNTDEWLEWRKSKVGASDVPIIMGLSPYATPLQLWKRKLGFTQEPPSHAGMRRGHDLEPMVRDLVNKELKKVFTPETVQHATHEWATASLDGLSQDGMTIIEIKCPALEDHKKAKKGEVPEKYYPQVQWQMFVYKSLNKDFKNFYYCSWHDDDLVTIKVPYDDNFMNRCFYECEQFASCLENYTPPALSERDHVNIDDEEFGKAAVAYINAKHNLDEARKQEAYWKEKLVSFTDDGNCEGFGVKLTRVEQRGSIDWDKVLEHYKIEKDDLDKFRKEQIGYWKVSIADIA